MAKLKWTDAMFEKVVNFKDSSKLTWKQIASKFSGATPNMMRKAYYRFKNKAASPLNSTKILVIDIETAPLEVFTWGIHEQNIGLEMIKEDWSILSFSAKWLGAPESEIMYYDNRNEDSPRNDTKLLKTVHSLLEEADVLLVQNGARFDVPKLNARFILKGMKPPSSYKIIDTYRIAKKNFSFTSNKLAYMTDKLCTTYKKLDHGEFAGFKLWKECLNGNLKAWKSMEKYNKYDILSLEELYYKLAPWDNTINFEVYSEDLKQRCTCGSDDIKANGYVYTKTAKYQRFTCKNCGKETRSRENLLSKEKKKSLKV